MSKRHWIPRHPLPTSHRSGLRLGTPDQHQRHGLAQLEQQFSEANAVISRRGDFIPVAPRFYNNDDDMDRLLAALP
jgi:hypothetical protein